jgi:uncharacterized protein YbaR (Trm112 family)
MIEYEFKDINHCPTCRGKGELIFVGYTIEGLLKAAIDNNTYMKRPNVMCCPKCKGSGKCLTELEIEVVKDEVEDEI